MYSIGVNKAILIGRIADEPTLFDPEDDETKKLNEPFIKCTIQTTHFNYKKEAFTELVSIYIPLKKIKKYTELLQEGKNIFIDGNITYIIKDPSKKSPYSRKLIVIANMIRIL